MLKSIKAVALAALAAGLLAGVARAGDDPAYDGRRKCVGCHKAQAVSWQATAHAKALESLAPGVKADAKRKAGLDPAKDYRAAADCVGCHVTGYGAEGGYDPKEPDEFVTGVGCESCHGPGSAYRQLHRKAGERFEAGGKTAPRQKLADAGQEFQFRERCAACHLNYQGSPWAGAKPPFTPFTPKLDPRYSFDFDRALRDDKAMHAHFKLDGVFVGPPLPDFHAAFQASAKPLTEKPGKGD